MALESSPDRITVGARYSPEQQQQDYANFWNTVDDSSEVLTTMLTKINADAAQAKASGQAMMQAGTVLGMALSELEKDYIREEYLPDNDSVLAAFTVFNAALDGEPVGPYDLLRFREEQENLRELSRGRRVMIAEREPNAETGELEATGRTAIIETVGTPRAYLDVFRDPSSGEYDCRLLFDIRAKEAPELRAGAPNEPIKLRVYPEELVTIPQLSH